MSYRSITSRFPPFAFVELISPYNKKNITRWREDMNFMFEWQEQYLTRSLRSLVRYCSCHSNIKFISSRQRVISSIYHMTRTAPRAISLENHKGKVPYEGRTRRSDRAGKTRTERKRVRQNRCELMTKTILLLPKFLLISV